MQDWLGRVRPGLAKLAFTAGRYGECVRQAGLVLASVARTRPGELDTTGLARLAGLALARLLASHQLTGLYAWARERAGTKLRWVPGLADLAKGNTEAGVKALQTVLQAGAGLFWVCSQCY